MDVDGGRDQRGRFVKGSVGNPSGRAPKEREERYYEITMSSVTYEDWRAIVIKAKDQAKKGDASARKWLADYLIGPPVQKNENDNKNSGSLTITVNHVTTGI